MDSTSCWILHLTLGLSVRMPIDGTSVRCCIMRIALTMLPMPDAASMCPRLPLTDPVENGIVRCGACENTW